MIEKYCLICIFLLGTFLGKAESIWHKADSLMAVRNFQDAQIEYERIFFYSENQAISNQAIYKRGLCLKFQGDYSKAFNLLKRINYISISDSVKAIFHYETALCAYLSGNFGDAEFQLVFLGDLRMSDLFRRRITLLTLLTLNELQKWEEAKPLAIKYIGSGAGTKVSDSLNLLVSNLYEHPPRLRRHKTADILQVVPGLGQIYAGKPMEGIINFGLNAAFLGFGVYQCWHRLYITGYFVGAIGISKFYFGGHSRTDFLVDKLNYTRAKAYNSALKELLTGLAL